MILQYSQRNEVGKIKETIISNVDSVDIEDMVITVLVNTLNGKSQAKFYTSDESIIEMFLISDSGVVLKDIICNRSYRN